MAEQGIPIIGPILNKIIGTRNERFVKRYTQRVNEINGLETQVRQLTDEQIRSKMADFRKRVDAGEDKDRVMVEAFAVAREGMDRAVGIRNVFNPKHNFDPSKLPADMQALYAEIKAKADAIPVIVPRTYMEDQNTIIPQNAEPDQKDEFLGHTEMVPGWRRVEVPPKFYDAVRALYPESRPPFRARPFDVQLIGGMVLGQGKISEMKTGEGKTIVGPLATYMACIERMKVHVVTVNDYLVQRDRDWTFPFFHALGMTAGAIHPQHQQPEELKRFMYRCDVVYGTTAEFGFDFLRDNMKRSVEQQVQKKRDFAIVDEVDSILIDEARTPLIISGQAHEDTPRYELADRLARHLVSKQRPWNEMEEKVNRCEMRIKGLEGDIRQARDKSAVPALQQQLAEAKKELPGIKAERDLQKQYYEVKMERKQCHLTHEGVSEAQRAAQIGSFYIEENMDLPHLLEQSLRAHTVYELDRDYIVREIPDQFTGRPTPSVVIVDTNTGRPMVGRQWSDGLHQAVECKERVPIKQETQTVASITIQNFFKMYKRLAGMTGTADTEAQEFHDIYKLDVVAIPTNRPIRRGDFDDVVFLSGKDKWNAITDEIKAFCDGGRPVLVGTTSVEKSESLSKLLTNKYAVQHEVLNAKQHDREAHIVENAGQLGAVMIATNMAGRGTDIKLGKISREQLLDHWLRRGIAPRTLTVDASESEVREQIYRKIASKELEIDKKQAETMPFAELELQLLRKWANKYTWIGPDKVAKAGVDALREALDENGRFLLHRIRWFETIEDMGGLHVIGTERHEARRIDNQLRGRSGRQGDKGSSRFFVSLDDDLMKMFAGETTMKILASLGMKEGDAIEHPMLSKRIEGAQRKVEERNFQIRKQVLEYDEVMEAQRQYFYGQRQRVLEGRDVRGLLFDMVRTTVKSGVDKYLDELYPCECAAEFAKNTVECSIAPEKLKGMSFEEMDIAIRDEAKYDARQAIELTLGEYLPSEDSEVKVDYDTEGLIKWARNRFGVELDATRLQGGSAEERQYVRDMLVQRAEEVVERADLSGIREYTQKDFGAAELSKWLKDKLGFDVRTQDIINAQKDADRNNPDPVTTMVMQRVEQWYHRREIEYPVEYGIGMFQNMVRQPGIGPQEAAKAFLQWANMRFGLSWTQDIFKTSTLQTASQQLMQASQKFVDERRMEKEMAEAIATKTDDELNAYWEKNYLRPLPENMRYLSGDERTNAIRAGVENIRRLELLRFERTILIDTLDGQWKDHLYAMDQLRDTIGFRTFSQNDPRIEYKREGSQMFKDMLENVKLRVTEMLFKARLTPPQPQQNFAPRPAPRPMAPAGGMGGMGGLGIIGPGIGGGISGPGLSSGPAQA